MTARCLSPAAITRLADEIERTARIVRNRGQEIEAYCAEQAARLEQDARDLREALADEEALEMGREFVGPTLMVRKGAA